MVLQDQQTHLEVSEVARTRILQVSPDGRTIRQRVQILSLEGRTSREAKWTPQPLKGVTLEITLSPKLALVRTDGKILAESLRQYLELIYTVSDPAIKYTDDVIFGPSGPVRVGDTWTADTEKMISELNQKGELKLSPNDMVSLFSLDARKIVNGIDCLVVHGTLEANRIEQASGNTIPLRDFSGKIHATFHKVVPVDTAKTEIAEDSDGMEMEMSGKATSPQGGEVDVLMSESDEMDTTTLPNGSR